MNGKPDVSETCRHSDWVSYTRLLREQSFDLTPCQSAWSILLKNGHTSDRRCVGAILSSASSGHAGSGSRRIESSNALGALRNVDVSFTALVLELYEAELDSPDWRLRPIQGRPRRRHSSSRPIVDHHLQLVERGFPGQDSLSAAAEKVLKTFGSKILAGSFQGRAELKAPVGSCAMQAAKGEA